MPTTNDEEPVPYTVPPFGSVSVCPECFCLDIEWEDWVTARDNQPSGGGTGADHVYCQACGAVTDDGCMERGSLTVDRGTPGVWEIPPRAWFASENAHHMQIRRLRRFGIKAAARYEGRAA